MLHLQVRPDRPYGEIHLADVAGYPGTSARSEPTEPLDPIPVQFCQKAHPNPTRGADLPLRLLGVDDQAYLFEESHRGVEGVLKQDWIPRGNESIVHVESGEEPPDLQANAAVGGLLAKSFS